MGVEIANFPTSNWDGSTDNRSDYTSVDKAPDSRDWDRVTAELVALETFVRKQYFQNCINANASTVVICRPMYVKSDGQMDLADANGSGTRHCIGLVTASIATTATGEVQIDGIFEATAAQWDVVTGGSGGLTPGASYYVSATVGALTTTAPSTTGDTDCLVGVALSATKMRLILGSKLVISA